MLDGYLLIFVFRVLALTIAGELAAKRPDVRGPGTFLPALIDEIGLLDPEVVRQRAQIEFSLP